MGPCRHGHVSLHRWVTLTRREIEIVKLALSNISATTIWQLAASALALLYRLTQEVPSSAVPEIIGLAVQLWFAITEFGEKFRLARNVINAISRDSDKR